MWQSYFDRIVVLNLKKRSDRRDRMCELFEKYEINGELYESIEHEKGAIGLSLTMNKLFTECLENGVCKLLVFEDDCEIKAAPEEFNSVMEKCVTDLQSRNWGMFYLGLQHVRKFENWITPNLLPVTCGYSTHAVAYSREAMDFFIHRIVMEPIDNFIVREYQPYGNSYCSYPLLVTQRKGYSNIENNEVDWNMYIERTFSDHTKYILHLRK